MKSARLLIEEIIDEAVQDRIGVATLLRKCRIVSEQYANEDLTSWVLNELNGYDDWKSLPAYRVIPAGAKGFMVGPMGAQINAQPLASAIMDEEHRHFAESTYMREPASSYENLKDVGDGGYRVEWPANLVLKYQSKFIRGYALNRAWQDVPTHCLRAIPETVRNRILEFSLSLRKEFGPSLDASSESINQHIRTVVHSILEAR